MNISIIGSGTVGRAVGKVFSRFYDVTFYDVDSRILKMLSKDGYKVAYSLKDAILETDISFVTVPTPTVNMRIDTSYLEAVLNEMSKIEKDEHVVAIKSTVLPGIVEKLVQKFNSNYEFCLNPEFLRSEVAEEDFKTQDVFIGVIPGYETAGDVLKKLYEDFRVKVESDFWIYVVDSYTAAMVKYASNLLLATKISLFNEINEVCKKLNVNTFFIIRNVLSDRVPTMNMYLRDFLRYGFQDECLPKDLDAFINFAEELGVNVKLLKSVREVNKKKINESSCYC